MPGPILSAPPVSVTTAFEEQYPRTPRRTILGRGAFGIVFLVTSPDDPECRYVAKEINLSAISPKKQRDTLIEIQLLRSLSHPNVVTCIDAVLVDCSLYIIMEFASGGDLAQKIRQQRDLETRFPERTVMTVFAQAAAALKFVHERKILHRDIKPANIFVFGCGGLDTSLVKIGDFGLGKMFDGTTFEANSVVGSPAYFSPEVCKGKPYGRKSDVWSLGVVLHELAALSVPFLAKTIIAAAVMICKTEAPALPDEYSGELRDLIGRLLQKEPKARPAIAAVFEEPFVQRFTTAAEKCGEAPSAKAVGIVGSGLSFARQTSEEEPEAELSNTRSSGVAGPGAVHAALRQNFPEGARAVSVEAMLQLLPLVAPGLTRTAAAQVLSAAGCKGEAIDLVSFVEWLGAESTG